ncbi:AraC family transcriptional regulator ligand-binding domain-containing protein [Nocardia sp. NPDC049737]|uniref:AraC family transcriptional regulator ligand-binding domain-containing protein n=1 Tax=Nocardia sp. NPDC049737 TaxID=3154358 RepID=UPI003425E598
MGIRIGSRDVLMSWGLVGFVVRSARSAAEALEIGVHLHQAAGSLVDLEVGYGTDEFELRLSERSPHPDLLPFLCEEACSSIVSLIRAHRCGRPSHWLLLARTPSAGAPL